MEKTLTSLSISALLLLTVALSIAWSYPANGYEPSIYLSTPIIYWVALACCYSLSGFMLCLYIRQDNLSSRLKIAGCLLFILATISFIALFILRSHLIYCVYGDTGVHIGNLLNFISTGHISSVYPGAYIDTVVLYLTTNIELYRLLNYHALIFGCMFVMSIYLTAREISGNKRLALLTAYISCLFPFGSAYYSTGGWTFSMYIPYLLTFLLFPYLIYMVIKIINQPSIYHRFIIITTMFCIILSLFHLLAALISFILIICLLITIFIQKHQRRKQIVIQVGSIFLSSGIFYILWVATTYYFQSQILSLTNLLFSGDVSSHNKDTLSEMSNSLFSNFGVVEISDFILRSYGLLILLSLLALLSLPLIIKQIQHSPKEGMYCVFYLFIMSCGILILYSLVGTASYQTGRVVPFIVLGYIFLTGYLLYSLLQKGKNRKMKCFASWAAVLLLIIIVILSIGSYYQAPHTLTTPNQETHAVLCDMNFYLYHINHQYNDAGLYYYPYVYAKAMIGTNYILTKFADIELPYGVANYPSPPDHFNYPTTNYVRDYYVNPTYLIINQKYIDDFNHKYVRDTQVKFELIDIDHLESDLTVNKIHDDFIDIYFIY